MHNTYVHIRFLNTFSREISSNRDPSLVLMFQSSEYNFELDVIFFSIDVIERNYSNITRTEKTNLFLIIKCILKTTKLSIKRIIF